MKLSAILIAYMSDISVSNFGVDRQEVYFAVHIVEKATIGSLAVVFLARQCIGL